jgi:hypothetical protein
MHLRRDRAVAHQKPERIHGAEMLGAVGETNKYMPLPSASLRAFSDGIAFLQMASMSLFVDQFRASCFGKATMPGSMPDE